MTPVPTSDSATRLPPEFRALVAICVLDFLVGCWLALQHEATISLGYLAQLPALGLGALLWGFLPSTDKEGVGTWLAQQLSRRWVLRTCFTLAVILGVVSLVRSSIAIAAVAPDTAVSIDLVDGNQAHPDTSALANAQHLRLNRLTTPVRSGLWILPWGRPVWLVTSSAVCFRDQRVLPWLPKKLLYPDDFVPLATIAVLPSAAMLARLTTGVYWLTIVAGDDSSDTLARGRLGKHGSLVTFRAPPPLLEQSRARWLARLGQTPSPDMITLVDMWRAAWSPGNTIAARRPLQVGEAVRWKMRSDTGDVGHGSMTLDSVVTDLYVAF
jgi:hypothetical protein